MDDDELEPPPMLLPGSEARHLARAIIVLTVLVLALAAFLFVAAPGFMGGWGADRVEHRPIAILVPLVGFGMLFTGLAWMARIYRSMLDVEPDQDAWRYRSR